jgi:hypothetical protein
LGDATTSVYSQAAADPPYCATRKRAFPLVSCLQTANDAQAVSGIRIITGLSGNIRPVLGAARYLLLSIEDIGFLP